MIEFINLLLLQVKLNIWSGADWRIEARDITHASTMSFFFRFGEIFIKNDIRTSLDLPIYRFYTVYLKFWMN